MEERIRPTKSGLFSIELLICVGVFAFCASVCMGIFVRAELMSRESEELNQAVSEARSLAERWKAAGGDLERTAALGGGRVEDGTLILQRERLVLRLAPEEGTLTASCDGRLLLDWTVAALPRTAEAADASAMARAVTDADTNANRSDANENDYSSGAYGTPDGSGEAGP